MKRLSRKNKDRIKKESRYNQRKGKKKQPEVSEE